MLEQKKQAISIRLGEGDIRNIKRMAKRLGVRDSDVIRFAIKSMLNRVSPLCDDSIHGRGLVPLLVEFGDELIRYFEIDSYRLESIINESAAEESRVHRDDVALLALHGLRDEYLLIRMQEGSGVQLESAQRNHSLRAYLYEKYVYRNEEVRAEAVAVGDRSSELRAATG